jgi:hypothetical protein
LSPAPLLFNGLRDNLTTQVVVGEVPARQDPHRNREQSPRKIGANRNVGKALAMESGTDSDSDLPALNREPLLAVSVGKVARATSRRRCHATTPAESEPAHGNDHHGA